MMKASSDFFESSSVQNSDTRIETSQFSMAIFEREMSAQIWEGLTCALNAHVRWAARFNRSKRLH